MSNSQLKCVALNNVPAFDTLELSIECQAGLMNGSSAAQKVTYPELLNALSGQATQAISVQGTVEQLAVKRMASFAVEPSILELEAVWKSFSKALLSMTSVLAVDVQCEDLKLWQGIKQVLKQHIIMEKRLMMGRGQEPIGHRDCMDAGHPNHPLVAN